MLDRPNFCGDSRLRSIRCGCAAAAAAAAAATAIRGVVWGAVEMAAPHAAQEGEAARKAAARAAAKELHAAREENARKVSVIEELRRGDGIPCTATHWAQPEYI
jgi:hypothetical protein